MQSPSAPPNTIPLRSPTPPSSGDDLNDLDQELARLDDAEAKRPHFLDYNPDPPPDFNSIQIPIQPTSTHALTNGTAHMNGFANTEAHGSGNGTKKHFLDENPIRPDYDYERRHHRSLDREYDRDGRKWMDICQLNYVGERRHSIERAKQQKMPKEPSYALSKFLETNDDRVNGDSLDKHHEYIGRNYAGASAERLGTKVDCVYSLLSMIGRNNAVYISGKFLELSKLPGTCSTLRGCIPWLVNAIHFETDEVTRKQARQALHNVVHQPDDKAGRREAKVLRHIEQILDYCDVQKQNNNTSVQIIDSDSHPLQAMSSLMKVSRKRS